MAEKTLLEKARAEKKDEFYTQLTDIEKEMKHYRKHFKDKIIFCNCDDPFESNFFKYFVLNFNRLKIKKLICTCYSNSPVAGTELTLFNCNDFPNNDFPKNETKPYKAIVTKVYDKTGDGSIGLDDIKLLFQSGENELTELKGDGDFRSEECLKLLDESDIVVTNPPFSLFRDYLDILMKHKKKFIIIGNQNAITYKEFFPLLMNNQIWLGVSMNGGNRYFAVPDDYPLIHGKIEDGKKYAFVKGCRWFTNLDIKKRHEELILVKHYDAEYYPKSLNLQFVDMT